MKAPRIYPRTFEKVAFSVAAVWRLENFLIEKKRYELSFEKACILMKLKDFMVPRARLELARQCDPTQDFKSCASTNFATGAMGSNCPDGVWLVNVFKRVGNPIPRSFREFRARLFCDGGAFLTLSPAGVPGSGRRRRGRP
jgi:hypothetical protein